MSFILVIVLGALTTFSPIIISMLFAWCQDLLAKNKARNANRNDYDELMKRVVHLSTMRSRLRAAWHDKRLLGLQKKVMVPKEDKQGNMVDKSGSVVDDPSQAAMVPAKDDDGKVIKEYSLDKFTDKYCNPNLKEKKPLPVDPGKNVPTWVRTYKIGFLASFVVSSLIILVRLWPLLIIPFIISSVVLSVMIKQGKACIQSEDATWEKIGTIYSKFFGSALKNGATVKDMVQITGWEAAGEAQAVADAIVYASEIGQSEEADKIIHPRDKRGREVKPRIARFRDVPSSMVISFDANFMQSSIPAFMDHINQTIGGGTVEWIAQREVNRNGRIVQKDGWDFDKQKVWLKTMPPLPTMASLPDDLDETPWNLIRLGRSVNGEVTWDLSGQGWGAKMEKSEDGKLHQVLDKNGKPVPDDKHHSEQAGITCPMGLVPLDVNTMVWTLVPTDGSGHEVRMDADLQTVSNADDDGSILTN
jgi:hypothetical protein